jgi:K+-transporting ATPase KdpF subunit
VPLRPCSRYWRPEFRDADRPVELHRQLLTKCDFNPVHSLTTAHLSFNRPLFNRGNPMTTILLWLLIIAIGIYLLVAMLRPDKF